MTLTLKGPLSYAIEFDHICVSRVFKLGLRCLTTGWRRRRRRSKDTYEKDTTDLPAAVKIGV